MDEHLSPAAIRAVERAMRSANDRGEESVDAGDLLAGLLGDDAGCVAVWLQSKGVSPDKILLALGLSEQISDIDAGHIKLGSVARQVINRGKEWSVYLNRFEPAGTEELFIGLIEAWPEAAAFFGSFGIDAASAVADYRARIESSAIPVESETTGWLEGEVTHQIDVARVLDASGNRAAEALRVLEDYARFVLDDARLCGELKSIRHRLRQALAFVPDEWLAAARDSRRDVGALLEAPAEYARENMAAVVRANCKRAQEALRTLEECAKTESQPTAREFERLRYGVYAVERELVATRKATDRLRDVRLYWLADPNVCAASFDWMVDEACAGGVQAIQLRDKQSSDRELVETARQLRRWTKECDVLFIVNDRPDLAVLADADGVHVGQEELRVKDVRRIVGPERLIGVSTHTIEQARRAVEDGADYLGVGPVFSSETKTFAALAGLDFVAAVAAEISLPAFCIGGVNEANLRDVLEAGGRRIAVGNVLCAAREPAPVARRLRAILDEYPMAPRSKT